MSLCINPGCSKPENPSNVLFCQNCGSELLLEGRYRTTKLLGQGGFGKTYEVINVRSKTARVLKILINNQPKAVELFQREAEVLKVLDSPGIPKVEQDGYFVYHPRSQQPLHCLVMEKIEGMNLYEYLKHRDGRPIDQKLAVQWLKQLVNILQLVHEQKYFHRDIKPPNIMLRASGDLVLIDFGAAREATQTYYVAHQQGNVTGVISVGYTPSEQINGQAIPQSDFFALGRTFVFLLTGKEPNDPAIFDSYNDRMGWRDLVSDISPKFADLIDSMMARSPSHRPRNTHQILQKLAEIEIGLNLSRGNYQPQRSPSSTSASPSPTLPSPSPLAEKSTIDSVFWSWWLVANIVGAGVGGWLLPISQFWVLRRQEQWVPKTGWWAFIWVLVLFLVNGVGGLLAFAILHLIVAGNWQNDGLVFVGFIIGFFVFLIVTGLILIRFEDFLHSKK